MTLKYLDECRNLFPDLVNGTGHDGMVGDAHGFAFLITALLNIMMTTNNKTETSAPKLSITFKYRCANDILRFRYLWVAASMCQSPCFEAMTSS